MGNTPTGCADDLFTILEILKTDPQSRSVNILSSNWILTQTVKKKHFDQPKLRPVYELPCRPLSRQFP